MDLRCFIAIELPDDLKKNISGLTEGLRAAGKKIRWVPTENLHLTLKFLGNTPEELIPEIRDRLVRVTGGLGSFTLAFRGTGVFPDIRRPRVIWAGVRDADVLSGIYTDIEKSMEELGYAPEGRPFSAHLTLGRVKAPGGLGALRKELDALRETEFGVMEVREVSLMRSELRPSGARYMKLLGVALAG